ncbi:MAG: DUF192 domain-containing protein [Planctomycetes bacterium]|nr:DUF192 domain-containing protein [Planctomycetota bacterium]
MRRRVVILFGASCLTVGCVALVPPATDDASSSDLPKGVVLIGEHEFRVEIADTNASRTQGLMDRTSLADDAGMLFIFDRPADLSFWMLNTSIPLDIAFIREDMTVSSIDTMTPHSLESHLSIELVPFALEVPAGEFSRRGIEAGDAVVFEWVVPE